MHWSEAWMFRVKCAATWYQRAVLIAATSSSARAYSTSRILSVIIDKMFCYKLIMSWPSDYFVNLELPSCVHQTLFYAWKIHQPLFHRKCKCNTKNDQWYGNFWDPREVFLVLFGTTIQLKYIIKIFYKILALVKILTSLVTRWLLCVTLII